MNVPVNFEITDDLVDALAQRVRDKIAIDLTRQPEPWLTVEGAAQHLAMSKSQVYGLCSKRQIPVHKHGSRSYFKASELDEWRDGNDRSSTYAPNR